MVGDDDATGGVVGLRAAERIATTLADGNDTGRCSDSRCILNGIVFGHRLGKSGIKVGQAVMLSDS